MIPEIYASDITAAQQTRIAFLPDCISCTVTEERNGVFECFMQYPANGASFDEIRLERVLSVKPNHSMDDQLFRIYRISKPLNGVVSVYAQHISYDLSNAAVMPFTENSITPAALLTKLLEGTGFISSTNFSTSSAFSVNTPKSVRACLGGTEGSVLSVWKGEYTFNNFSVYFRNARGADRGVSIEYGKNLTELEHDLDDTDVYTCVLPYAVRDDTVTSLTEKIIQVTSDLTKDI